MITLLKQLTKSNSSAQILQMATKPTQIVNTATPQSTTPKPAPTAEEIPATKVAKLIMVTRNNNNKFYEMRENTDGTFTVRYGRVGASAATCTYPMRQWDRKKREKIRKGYQDQTHLFALENTAVESTSFAEIHEVAVRQLIHDLSTFARTSISQNYNVTADQVTRKQVETAQILLDELVGQINLTMNTPQFNNQLLELYQVIPRRMSRVQDHLITAPTTQKELDIIEKMLAEEQATLDVMRGQVEANSQQEEAPQEKLTLTEALGIQVEQVTNEQLIKHIKKMMGDHKDKFFRAFKITNNKSQGAFDNFVKSSQNQKTELFWHGSRNENWLNILKTGLILRPANAVITGKMFGYGLYFADKFRKSLNYTSLRGSYWANGTRDRGYLALYDVHVGNPLNIQKHESWCYELTDKNLKKRGTYDSLFAKGGVDLINNEYIVYNQAQCTVRYLVEVR